MKLNSIKRSTLALPFALALTQLVGCAIQAVDPGDRDTSGQYDGIWVGHVDEPRSSRVNLPGKWFMRCGWEPFSVHFVVKDGFLQLREDGEKEPVGVEGRFRAEDTAGMAKMKSGVMPGNGKWVHVFSGYLSEDNLEGEYLQYITSRGSTGCNAKMKLERYQG